MTFPEATTHLARFARWLGLIGLLLLGLAVAIVVGSVVFGGDVNAQFGYSILIAVPGLACGIVALPLSLTAFYLPATRQTLNGERDGTIALLASVIAVLLSCLIVSIVGAS